MQQEMIMDHNGTDASSPNQQENRRKMLRRAANRRSAQLSRARKKAHLEELKIENSRLQRMVDILDSQPELVFCILADGRITYMSERCETFLNTNLSGTGSNEIPTHLNQILCKESATGILSNISRLEVVSPGQGHDEGNILFSAKEVYFHDAFGAPLVGSLRCSKVVRRTTLQELQNADESFQDFSDSKMKNSNTSRLTSPPLKKQRSSSSSSSSSSSNKLSAPITMLPPPPTVENPSDVLRSAMETAAAGNSSTDGWNFANFKILTDCVSSLTGEEPNIYQAVSSRTAAKGNTTNDSSSLHNTSNFKSVKQETHQIGSVSYSTLTGIEKLQPLATAATSQRDLHTLNCSGISAMEKSSSTGTVCSVDMNGDADEPVEFVCVIRTSENCFVPHRGSANLPSGLLLFSSQLSTASMVAHDLKLGGVAPKPKRETGDGTTESADSEENSESNNSSGAQPNSDSSKNMRQGSTISETGSEDNNMSETNSEREKTQSDLGESNSEKMCS